MDTIDQIQDNLWTSDYVQKNPNKSYKSQYNAEYLAVAEYMNGGDRPNPANYSKMGKTLVGLEDQRRAVTPEPEPEPPPVSGGLSNPYFDESFVNISAPEWDAVQTYAYAPSHGFNPGTGVQGDSSGRLALVPAPDGVGKALRLEIRNTDGKWNNQSPEVHRCQLGAPTTSIWDASIMTIGDIRYFDMELWIPNEFDFARDTWNALIGVHPSGSTGWGAFNIVVEGHSGNSNASIDLKLGGGSPPGTTANLNYYPLIQLTDGSGNIYAPNRNRRIHLRYGGRFAPDNTGWAEAWVDGKNVLPRFNHPTCWADDFHQYMKLGPYKLKAAPYPSGKTVIYFTRIQIGRTV